MKAQLRHQPRRLGAVVLGVAAIIATTLVIAHTVGARATSAACTATVGASTYPLDAEQAINASTIAAVGSGQALPDHAVTVALATALQESNLHNLAAGDRDSVGLFQQRPSQGWGTAEQIRSPRYASRAFYDRLVKVPDWQTLTVTDAAQAVQLSASPRAYAGQEAEARVLAQALTGEAPAALTCRAPLGAGPTLTASLAAGMRAELGGPSLGVGVSTVRAWAIAAWLIAHAHAYRIQSVSFGDQRWSAATGRWAAHGDVGPGVRINTV